MTDDSKLKICDNRGFHITFDNGVTVSVQFGYSNYCSNRDLDKSIETQGKPNTPQTSNTAEIAIWDSDDNWITQQFKDEGDTVLGWQTPEDILEAMNWAKNYKVIE